MSLFVGHARAGFAGLLVAGLSFVLPATAIVVALSWAYVRFGALPAVPHFLLGVKPVVLAIVATALVSLGRTAVKTRALFALGLAALWAAFFVHELLLLLVAGCVSAGVMQIEDFLGKVRGPAAQATPEPRGAPEAPTEPQGAGGAPPHSPSKKSSSLFLPPLLFSSAGVSSFSLSSLFLVCLKTGAVLFGSGFVLFAYFRADFVERLHWLTNAQLLDAIAVGQFTPGAVVLRDVVGYLLAGPRARRRDGGIFLPAFAFVAACGPVPRLRASRPSARSSTASTSRPRAHGGRDAPARAPGLVDARTTVLFSCRRRPRRLPDQRCVARPGRRGARRRRLTTYNSARRATALPRARAHQGE